MKLAWLLWASTLFLGEINFSRAVTNSPYTWICEESRCLRKIKDDSTAGVPMDVCKLNCDDLGSLWPKPTGNVIIGKNLVSLYPSNITWTNVDENPEPIKNMLTEAFQIFRGYLTMMHAGPILGTEDALHHKLEVSISVTSDTTEISIPDTDESYNLTVSTPENPGMDNVTTVTAQISAVTYFGARHALETLSQLIAYDNVNDVLQMVNNVTIEDKPVFAYRGIMLDTSRNYFSLEKIRRLIDGMSYNKLSVLHWHITDTHSFPMEVTRRPKMMEYGAYSPDKIYKANDIKDLVQYAKQRGIKIIPELDQPAHSGHGYQWGKMDNLGDLVVCVESEPWYDFCVEPPCGQLNIVNENVTDVIGDIFEDMLEMFDNDIFHMGGDEVDFRCYNSSKEITDWMSANNYSLDADGFYRLWGEFQEKILQKLLSASSTNDTKIMMWTSGLTHPDRIEQYLDKNRYIIQIWTASDDPIIHGILQKGYKVIFSNVNALYLDCGFPAWLGNGHNWCSPMKGWQTVYDNDPEKIYAQWADEAAAEEAVLTRQILGSETPLWTEQADEKALESRIWPRASAHAERLWTHPASNHSEAEFRMVTNRNRMVARGIDADRLQPEFCLQNEGKCYAERPTYSGTSPLYTSNIVIALAFGAASFFFSSFHF